MSSRRDFIKQLALLSAGAAAIPAQIEVFEKLFDTNSKAFGEASDLVRIEDFYVGGTAQASSVTELAWYRGKELWRVVPFNAFGGIVRLVRAPEQAMFARLGEFWIHCRVNGMSTLNPPLVGDMCYTDNSLEQHWVPVQGLLRL